MRIEEYKKKLKFDTFIDFCNNADEMKEAFAFLCEYGYLKLSVYKNYIYKRHKFSNNPNRDEMIKDKCWKWLLSYKYEKMDKNDLYAVLGYLRKEKC